MRFNTLILVYLFGIFSITAQNILVTGKVLNASTSEALPYAHIMFEAYSMGTSANENGYFGFSIPDSLRSENIIISYVGFQEERLSIDKVLDDKLVYLDPKREFLNEVSIAEILNKRQYTYRPEQWSEPIGIGNMNAALFPSTIARYYPKPSKFSGDCFLEFVEVYFFPVEEQNALASKFRFHLYSVGEDGKPGEDLLEETVLEKLPGQSSVKVELLNRKISIPEDGFYIGLEHLFITENEYSEIKDYYINDSLVAENFENKRYAPVYRGIIAKPSPDLKVYFYQPEGWIEISNWELSRKKLENNYIAPVFTIRITD